MGHFLFSVSCLCFLRHTRKSLLTDISSGMLECVRSLNHFSPSYSFRGGRVLPIQKSNLFSVHFLVKHLQTWICTSPNIDIAVLTFSPLYISFPFTDQRKSPIFSLDVKSISFFVLRLVSLVLRFYLVFFL